ncbi:LPS export ABC transporter permease LptG [Microbulbifer marinus]|uniref:Lipopolysaccharide export system permease protein n=1 Tax=Microbulbifer marinus TaxID=658218 RepID=A0A1H4A7Q7_9GAMM|nr:LPS export ABC transporter permease LptG [Microbulbifer marinus]SEA32015.1 lipopolysaccharide export system permease protein [Microbulbifer marinus]
MRKLDLYIGRTIALAVGAVLLVIVGLDVIFAMVDELGEMKADYQFIDVLQYVAWKIPDGIYDQLGFSALVGCMVGLGTLAGTSELTVMRAAGVSIGRIAWAVMKPVLLLIMLGLALAEFVIPKTNQVAENLKARELGELEASGLEQGLWLKDSGEFVHFNAALPDGVLYGVTRYRFGEERELQRVEFSERGRFGGDEWMLENSRATTFTAERSMSEVTTESEWHTDVSPELFALVVPLPSDLSPRNLWSYGTFLDRKGEDSSRYWLQFWKKLLQPLTIASLVMVAISFIFGPLREVTTGLRVFTGVIVGIVFQTMQDMLGPSSLVFGFPPFIAVLVPILFCFLVGWLLLKRAR